MRRRFLPTLVLAALLSPAAAHAMPIVGIADQKTDMFTDARFQRLGIRTVRVSFAWDLMTSAWQVAEADRYLALARAEGVEPLVTWQPSRLAGKRRVWPSPAQFVTQFKRFRARYPWVKTFSTWNEANFAGFGPYKEPQRVARWWLALTKACPSCTILGADLVDYPNMVRWTKGFLKAARKQPKAWGLHDYVSINRRQTKPIADLLRTIRGKVWLTETGGLVARRNSSRTKLPQGQVHAAAVMKLLMTTVATMPGVQRIYLYQWNSSTATDSWDSALVGWDGRARPALTQLTSRLPAARPLPALTVPQAQEMVSALPSVLPTTR
jgi:hypothetical protein